MQGIQAPSMEVDAEENQVVNVQPVVPAIDLTTAGVNGAGMGAEGEASHQEVGLSVLLADDGHFVQRLKADRQM